MPDESIIRSRFENMPRSEMLEELSRRDDYTAEAFRILEDVARSREIEPEALTDAPHPPATWRRKLKAGEAGEWYRLFDRAGHTDEGAIANRDMSQSIGRLFAGMLIVNGAFLIGVLFAYVYLAGGLLAYVFFAGGLVFTNRIVFGNQDPLELRRWRRCWQGDAVGYHASLAALTPLAAHLAKSFQDWLPAILTCVGLAALGGMLCGLLWAHVRDKQDKKLVLEAFRAWQIDREKEPGASS